ncbi:hypothetical protein ACO11K_002382 [Bacillus cytotoxicus]|nr:MULTISPECIES: hypothetical protein [unclassified Bacillus cereus group]
MYPLEKIVLYILSFLFFPIGIIVWIASFLSKSLEKRKVGRICLYTAFVSFLLSTALGIITFYTTTITSSL